MSQQIKKHGKTALVFGLTLMLLVMYFAVPQTNAAAISSRQMKLSNSQPSSTSTYDFQGTHSSTGVRCLEIVFCTTATGGCTSWAGDASTGLLSSTSVWSGWATATSTWVKGGAWTATRAFFTATNADGGGAAYSFAASDITNPSTGGTYYGRVTSYSAQACTTSVDSGVTAFAIISGVAVSATVVESLSFAIDAKTNAACDTTFGTYGGPDAAATNVAFGELSSLNTFYHACQDLSVQTNAGSGYQVTAYENRNLRDTVTSLNIADSTGNGGGMTETTTATWTTATNNGFAYTCNDVVGTDCSLATTGSYRQFACAGSNAECDPLTGAETATNVMESAAASTSTSTIEYRVTIGATQAAGSYSNTIVYIATPTY